MSIEKNFIVNAGVEVGTILNVGTNLTVNGSATVNTSLAVGNASVFTSVNSTAVSVANTLVSTSYIATGNSTVNSSITNTRVATGNSTVNAAVTATSLAIGNTSTNISLSATRLSIGNTTSNAVITPTSIDVDGTLTVQNLASFQGNVYVAGNLTVQGTTTFINSNSLDIGDNIITLNADLPPGSGPTENAGIEINRGASANVQLRWNETTDKWQITNDGTNYGDVRTTLSDIALGSETTGNYVATVAGGTGVYVTGSGSETAAVTVTIGQDVNATSSVAFAGVTVGNSSLKLNSIELATNRFIANASGITVTGFANVTTSVNTALFTTGGGFTANSTLVNTAAINVVNQVNTATLFATTSANVGANVQANTTAFRVGDASSNTVITATFIGGNSIAFLGNSNIYGDLSVTGNTTLGDAATDRITFNANSITIAANVSIDAGTLFVDSLNNRIGIGTNAPDAPLRVVGAANVTGNAVIGGTANITGNAVFSGTANVTGLTSLQGGMNTTTANASVALNVGANVVVNTSALFIGNATVNTVITSTMISGNSIAFLGNSTVTGFINVTSSVNAALFTTGTGFTANNTLANVNALNVVNRVNAATLFATTSANIASVVQANASGLYTSANVTADGQFIGPATGLTGTASQLTANNSTNFNGLGATAYVSNSALTGYGFVNNSVGTAFNSSNLAGLAATAYVSNSAFLGGTYTFTGVRAHSANVTISGNSTSQLLIGGTAVVANTTGITVGTSVSVNTSAFEVSSAVSTTTLTSTTIAINRIDPATANSTVNIIADSSGYGRIELGGDIGGYIDFKSPFADNYDHRILSNTTGLYIYGGSTTSAAANAIYFDAVANIDFSSNTLFVDALNSRVGIGTLTPGSTLTVNGAANVVGLATFNGGSNTTTANVVTALNVGAALQVNTIAVRVGTTINTVITSTMIGGNSIAFLGNTIISGDLSVTGNTTLGDAATNRITFNANTITIAANVSIDGGSLYVDSLNNRIGIGNTAPAHKLTISGNVYASANAFFGGNIFLDTNAAYVRGTFSDGVTPTRLIGVNAANSVFVGSIDAGAADIRVYGPSGTPVNIYSNATLHSTFAANGNLGVGTATPTYPLDVAGNTRITGDIIITGANSTINGVEIGYLEVPQNANNTNYTITANDSGKHIFNSTNATSLIYTIANNTNVPLAIGTAITFVNGNTATITIANSVGVTLQLAGTTTTGTRTLAAGGLATALKVGTNRWFVSGAGVS